MSVLEKLHDDILGVRGLEELTEPHTTIERILNAFIADHEEVEVRALNGSLEVGRPGTDGGSWTFWVSPYSAKAVPAIMKKRRSALTLAEAAEALDTAISELADMGHQRNAVIAWRKVYDARSDLAAALKRETDDV